MKITFEEYIKNPMGNKTAVFTQREMLRNIYVDKFDKILLRENGAIEHHLFRDDDKYIVYLKIPSEKIKGIYYDVVIEFYPGNIVTGMGASLKNYNIKVFSNDPAFIFTYAYVFNKNKLIIDDLIPKIGKIALEEKPSIKNPNQVIGYVKTLYFAYLYMKNKGLFNKEVFDSYSTKYSKTNLFNSVMAASKKINERINATVEKEKSDKANKVKSANNINNSRKVSKISNSSKTSHVVSKVKHAPFAKKAKVVKRHK